MKKIEDLNTSNGATTQQTESELTDTASVNKETDQKQAETAAEEQTKEPLVADVEKSNDTPAVRHMITFMGQGVWIDSTGTPWSKTEKDSMTVTATFTDDEFQKRDDLRFMVKYGAMKDILI